MSRFVLFVCAQNVCRSPLMETVFREVAPPSWMIRSAGVAALPGQPMCAVAGEQVAAGLGWGAPVPLSQQPYAPVAAGYETASREPAPEVQAPDVPSPGAAPEPSVGQALLPPWAGWVSAAVQREAVPAEEQNPETDSATVALPLLAEGHESSPEQAHEAEASVTSLLSSPDEGLDLTGEVRSEEEPEPLDDTELLERTVSVDAADLVDAADSVDPHGEEGPVDCADAEAPQDAASPAPAATEATQWPDGVMSVWGPLAASGSEKPLAGDTLPETLGAEDAELTEILDFAIPAFERVDLALPEGPLALVEVPSMTAPTTADDEEPWRPRRAMARAFEPDEFEDDEEVDVRVGSRAWIEPDSDPASVPVAEGNPEPDAETASDDEAEIASDDGAEAAFDSEPEVEDTIRLDLTQGEALITVQAALEAQRTPAIAIDVVPAALEGAPSTALVLVRRSSVPACVSVPPRNEPWWDLPKPGAVTTVVALTEVDVVIWSEDSHDPEAPGEDGDDVLTEERSQREAEPHLTAALEEDAGSADAVTVAEEAAEPTDAGVASERDSEHGDATEREILADDHTDQTEVEGRDDTSENADADESRERDEPCESEESCDSDVEITVVMASDVIAEEFRRPDAVTQAVTREEPEHEAASDPTEEQQAETEAPSGVDETRPPESWGTWGRSVDPGQPHRSAVLQAEDVKHADIIIVASRAERSEVALLDPLARARTFTLREALALGAAPIVMEEVDEVREVPSVDASNPISLYAAILDRRRGSVTPPQPTGPWWKRRARTDPWDIPDVHQAPERVHVSGLRSVARETRELASRMTVFARSMGDEVTP